ncbi:intron Large complex component GCFC2 isoform X3 [Peromyscus maniculatus bairdii]|uniref:intron Large complex component GCFC2 isoform X3 n=1 Tax=Peromyscus maniculatus bairdii TaxID=230844 RepID=UPI003FD35A57
MALRPQRTFRRRQVESSDSDSEGAEERPAEEPAEPCGPSAGGRAEGAAEPARRARGSRGRGRVWASSRRSPGTASRRDCDAGVLLESRTVDLSTDEEEETHPSPERKAGQSPSSSSSSSLEEKEVSPIVQIPDAAFIQEARRKRELARAPGDYISLDVHHPPTTSDRKRSDEEDPDSDPDDCEKRILFAPKPQTLRQRMAEETSIRNEEASEESQEDENQDIWEQQQMRKAVKIIELDSMGLNQMPWFTSITEFMENSMDDPRKEDDSDQNILSVVINRTVVPRLTDFVEFIWDPLSTSQTRSLTTHCRLVFEQSASEKEVSKSKQDLLKSVVVRIKKSVEDDVFIPLYPKSSEEGKMSAHSKFQERQFWGALKLFRNILLWNGLLPDDTLQDLGLGKLLNRYLIIALTNAFPGPDAVKKCSQIAACLPEKWFENSAMRTSIPQLENFIQFLLQSAHKLSSSEFRNEVNEIILILVKVKALNQAESLTEKHHLEPSTHPITSV